MIPFCCPGCQSPHDPAVGSTGLGARCSNCGEPFLMPRDRAAQMGQDTVQILLAGSYTAPSGNQVVISELLHQAIQATCSYPPDHPLPEAPTGNRPAEIQVVNETTLFAAQRLVQNGSTVLALNLASAKHPGGGFLSGSRAQEESLARSSGLYGCLKGDPMYDFHQAHPNAMYSDYAIYSPDVPVIRTDNGALLEEPWLCSFLTSPAVNAKAVLQKDSSKRPEIRQAMQQRIDRILAIAARHRHDVLILGAWGCGAFGNDSEEIAELFRAALTGPFSTVANQVVFAITDWSKEQKFIGPFAKAFQNQNG